jgi:hypothetical protein
LCGSDGGGNAFGCGAGSAFIGATVLWATSASPDGGGGASGVFRPNSLSKNPISSRIYSRFDFASTRDAT